MTYFFQTSATMKPYNNKKWWIDSNIIRDAKIEAVSIEEALTKYKKLVYDKTYIKISNNALKNKEPMYIDTKTGTVQVGYVITAKADFQDSENYRWSAQYIDLWVEISIITSAFADYNAEELPF